MKKSSLAIFVSLLSLAGASFAQSSEIRESTDPAKVREVEQHAEQLRARGHTPSADMSSGASDSDQATHPKKRHAVRKHHKAKKESGGEAAGTSGGSGGSASSRAGNQSMSDSAGQQQSGPSGAKNSINGPGTPKNSSSAKDKDASGASSSK